MNSAANPRGGGTGGGRTVLKVHVRPGASRNEIAGYYAEALAVRVAAPPEKGRANRALLDFLAGELGVGRADLEVVAGAGSRDKLIRVRSLGPGELARRLAEIAGHSPSPGPGRGERPATGRRPPDRE